MFRKTFDLDPRDIPEIVSDPRSHGGFSQRTNGMKAPTSPATQLLTALEVYEA